MEVPSVIQRKLSMVEVKINDRVVALCLVVLLAAAIVW